MTRAARTARHPGDRGAGGVPMADFDHDVATLYAHIFLPATDPQLRARRQLALAQWLSDPGEALAIASLREAYRHGELDFDGRSHLLRAWFDEFARQRRMDPLFAADAIAVSRTVPDPYFVADAEPIAGAADPLGPAYAGAVRFLAWFALLLPGSERGEVLTTAKDTLHAALAAGEFETRAELAAITRAWAARMIRSGLGERLGFPETMRPPSETLGIWLAGTLSSALAALGAIAAAAHLLSSGLAGPIPVLTLVIFGCSAYIGGLAVRAKQR